METAVCSLVYLFNYSGEVCMGRSLKGPTKGKWSGFGGKQEPPETVLQCAIRETEEECGVRVLSLEKAGVMLFHWPNSVVPGLGKPKCKSVEVHIFRTEQWEGELTPSSAFEDIRFFDPTIIPYHQMMPGEEIWFKRLLRRQRFSGEMCYHMVGDAVEYTYAELHENPRISLLNKP